MNLLAEIIFPSSRPWTVYVDMDGILADFDGAIQSTPRYYKLVLSQQRERDENARIRTGKELKKLTYKLAEQQGFFAGLEVLPGAEQIFEEVIKLCDGKRPHILTSPVHSRFCEPEKRAWMQEHFAGLYDRFICQANKAEYATPTSILIDDRKKNTEAWEVAGGIAILHNSKDVQRTIKRLQMIMNES